MNVFSVNPAPGIEEVPRTVNVYTPGFIPCTDAIYRGSDFQQKQNVASVISIREEYKRIARSRRSREAPGKYTINYQEPK